MKKARLFILLLAVVIGCSACGAPSLRHKKEVNKLIAAGDFNAAVQKIESVKKSEYSRRDRLLYQLDTGAVLHDAAQYPQSDERFAAAQDRIDELFTQSISAHVGQYIINDLTVPYQPAPYERMLTYYYRAMNFLSQQDINGALIEANRAVFYLDHLSGSEAAHWQNEPFIQYFMSLVFESAGKLDDARISRARAAQSNPGTVQTLKPSTSLPNGWGEVIVVHANGAVPLKKSKTFQISWNHLRVLFNEAQEGQRELSPEIQNAIVSGLLGNSITLSYPVLEDQSFRIASSEVITEQGEVYPTYLLGDVSGSARKDLKANETSTLLRMALRVATKRVAAVQAKKAASSASKEDTVGELTEMFFSLLGAATEKADTRQWFTLPAEFRITRLYVPAGTQNISLRFRDGNGNIIGEHVFENITIPAGGRRYLHYRTAK